MRRLWCQLRCKAQGAEPMGAADLNSTEEGLGVDRRGGDSGAAGRREGRFGLIYGSLT